MLQGLPSGACHHGSWARSSPAWTVRRGGMDAAVTHSDDFCSIAVALHCKARDEVHKSAVNNLNFVQNTADGQHLPAAASCT